MFDLSNVRTAANANACWVVVDKKTFDDFLDKYPRKLEMDFFMDRFAFYDFTLDEHPGIKSMVCYNYMESYYVKKEHYKVE